MSDNEARFRFALDGKEELNQFFEKASSGAKKFRSTVGTEMNAVGREISGMAATAGRTLTALGGIGAGFGIASTAKSVLELRDSLQGVAAVAGMAQSEIGGLKDQIISTSKATNQFGTDLADALNEFVAKTGDIDKGRKSLELFGKVATATRSSAKDIAAIGADMNKLGITDQNKAFSILAKQSDVGAVELRDLVSQGPRLLAAMQGAGLQGETGLRHGGALAQVFQQGTGNVERTSTAVEATFRDIAMRRDVLNSSGIKVDGRDRTDVLKDIITKSKGNEFVLRRIFGDEAFRGVQVMASEFRKTGKFGSFDTFSNVAADGSTIENKFALNTQSTLSKAKAAQINMQASADKNFGDTLDKAGGILPGVSGAFDAVTAHPLMAIGGLLAAKSALGMVQRWAGGAGGGGGVGGGIASALTGGGMPVRVTNWNESGGGVGGIAGALGGEAAGAAKSLGVLRLAAANANAVLASFAGGFAIGTWLDQKFHISDKIAGTRDGQIASEANKSDELPGQRSVRELDIAKGLAKQVRSGKLSGSAAARQLAAFSRNLEHTDDAGTSPMGQKLIDDLLMGNTDAITGRTSTSVQNEANTLALQKYKRPGASLSDDMTGVYSGGKVLLNEIMNGNLGQLLGSANQDTTKGASDIAKALKEMFGGMVFNITVGADGEATVDAPKGTRGPKVMSGRSAS
jgi:hypothetical protein